MAIERENDKMVQETITEETKREIIDKILAVFHEYNLNFNDTEDIILVLRRAAAKRYFQKWLFKGTYLGIMQK